MAQLLIDAGAPTDHSVRGDGSPLTAAVAAGQREMVDLLLRNGADVEFAPGLGDGSPLIAASLRGDLALTRLLVEHGAEVNQHVVGDDTPLINAAQRGSLPVLRFLLRRGADPWLEGDYDYVLGERRTAFNQARARGHEEIAGMLDGTRPLDLGDDEEDC